MPLSDRDFAELADHVDFQLFFSQPIMPPLQLSAETVDEFTE
jgi:hypothetical protein